MRLDLGFNMLPICDLLDSEVMEQSAPNRTWPGFQQIVKNKKAVRQKNISTS
jgi:hypothetical protein